LSKTRVCIKNLPPKTTEQDLKEFLSKTTDKATKVQITDCKILKNAKGKSRKVAFVGFRYPEQAEYVIQAFHRAFLNMTRITVEPAVAKKDENDETKAAEVASTNKENLLKTVEKQKETTEKDTKTDQKVKEFLDLMGASKKSKFWSNDAENEELGVAEQKPLNTAKKDLDDSSSSSSNSSDSEDEDQDEGRSENKPLDETKGSKMLSDLDFLKSKQKKVDDLEEEDSEDSSSASSSSSSEEEEEEDNEAGDNKANDANRDEQPNQKQEVVDMDENDEDEELDSEIHVSDSRLFVRNLPFETSEEELEEYFSPFGRVVECHIPVDDQKRNKGYAFVSFESAVDALAARTQLDKVDFQGRLLHVLKARPPPSSASSNTDNASSLTWKQKQELSRKEKDTKTAGKGSEGWSASFVRGDAVVDNLAERLGLRKGDLLGVKDDLSAGDAAVRLALGETQIIEENREYFRQHGVDMDVLVSANADGKEESVKRSKTAILVKNLPFDTRLEELTKLFHMGDVPVKILLPPSRTIALVEYEHSTDAKKAFRKLAYRRFKHVPIYLEWAPLKAKTSSTESSTTKQKSQPNTKSTKEMPTALQQITKEDDDADIEITSDGVSASLYVKNLNFETTEETLQSVFEAQLGKILSVRIPRKVAPTKNGNAESRPLSMGYGFIEVESHELAKKAIKMLQGKLVDGHALQLAISSNKSSQQSIKKSVITPSGKKTPTKIMVRNVPFQASRQELLKLFGTFGQLRKVRLPKKFDGSHRGFAFVEFLTGKEALAAMNALSRTHLYGRHLVLEWASDEDENIDQLRDKAKRDAVGVSGQQQNKKIRFT